MGEDGAEAAELFPANSETGGQAWTTPKVCETRADFDAKIAAFAKVVADYRDKAKNVEESGSRCLRRQGLRRLPRAVSRGLAALMS